MSKSLDPYLRAHVQGSWPRSKKEPIPKPKPKPNLRPRPRSNPPNPINQSNTLKQPPTYICSSNPLPHYPITQISPFWPSFKDVYYFHSHSLIHPYPNTHPYTPIYTPIYTHTLYFSILLDFPWYSNFTWYSNPLAQIPKKNPPETNYDSVNCIPFLNCTARRCKSNRRCKSIRRCSSFT